MMSLVVADSVAKPRDAFSVVPVGFVSPVGMTLDAATQRIVSTLKPERVILFGSFAYGAPTSDSDVDLLVIMDTDLSSSERYLAVLRLLRPRPFPVDILVKTPDEIRDALESGDFFVSEIIAQGKVLYERQ